MFSPMVLLFSSSGQPRAMTVACIDKEALGAILPTTPGEVSCTWHWDFSLKAHDFWEQP